ncbi:FABL049Cp [Eremothecium gossypii FDAG1]|nr:FABL049Cp [Eremothecium gossypii FDAG1]
MPLVLLTGFPSSGKTTYARQLEALLQAKCASSPELAKYTVVYHSDETLGIQHDDYKTSQGEKSARSKIMSVVKRDLSRNAIVIVDSLNYIKGFRYQLHCEVKHAMTTYCLVHCLAAYEKLVQWNTQQDTPWDAALLEALIQRYEEPNPATRWDSPLFAVLSGEDKLEAIADDVYKALFPQLYRDCADRETEKLLQGLTPNSATILKPAAHVNLVQVLDSETQAVVKTIMQHLQSNVVSGNIRVIVSETKDINDPSCCYVQLQSDRVGMAQLQRIRRQFVQMNKLRNIEKERIIPLFTEFLNKNLRSDL